jgi:hypothetical protein
MTPFWQIKMRDSPSSLRPMQRPHLRFAPQTLTLSVHAPSDTASEMVGHREELSALHGFDSSSRSDLLPSKLANTDLLPSKLAT